MREPEATGRKRDFRDTAKSLFLHSFVLCVQEAARLIDDVEGLFRVLAPASWCRMRG